jgi:archaellum component FlaC
MTFREKLEELNNVSGRVYGTLEALAFYENEFSDKSKHRSELETLERDIANCHRILNQLIAAYPHLPVQQLIGSY